MLNVLPATLYYSEIIMGLDTTLAALLVASPRTLVTALHDLRRRADKTWHGRLTGRSSASSGPTGPPSS